MAEVESYLLKKEDFLFTRRPDGTLVLTHPVLPGTIELRLNESPLWLFPRFKEFSEKHGILLSPELAKLAKGVEEDLRLGLQDFEQRPSDSLDAILDADFEKEFDRMIFGDDEDDVLLGFHLAKK